MRSSATALNTSPALRDFGQAGYLDRRGGTGLGHALSLIVYHGTDAADGGTGDDDIARLERTVLNQNGHDRAAALIKTRLDDGTLCGAVGIGLQLLHLCDENERFPSRFSMPMPVFADIGHTIGVAAPFLGDEVVLGELLLDPIGVRAAAYPSC